MIYPNSSAATGKRNVQYYNVSWDNTNVLGSSTAVDIVYADYDGVSKWYLSLENGTVIDQTGTSIGISFIGGTTGATTAPIPPIVRYIPELAGWFAIEYNSNTAAVSSITYQPKVYFRPDSTQIWGQISTTPSEYKGGYSSSVVYDPRLVYWDSRLYLFGLTKVNELRDASTLLSKYYLVSDDNGITWEAYQFSNSLAVPVSTFYSIMACSLDKSKPNANLLRISNMGEGTLQEEFDINVDPAANMIVETNNSAASPTTTTVYTRIA